MLRARVLIIEDDSEIRELLAELLRLEGCSIDTAENGRIALALLERPSERPDAIILDLMMPVMDGYEFLKAREKIPALAAIPVAVISGAATQPKLPELSIYLRKPMAFEEVHRFVRDSIGGGG